MCGIAGIIGLSQSQSENIVERMIQKMEHRGPDSGNIFVENKVALGHRRLSIIDLSTGANQPFIDNSENFIIVFNGEIYNYQEVKAKISNYAWKTQSDTEVILAAYQKWGIDCLQYFNGMFAFAIWDKAKQELILARDRLGVKPLYYYHKDDLLIFASEIRAILASNLVNKIICNDSISNYLSFQATKSPKSIIKDILQLNPGEYAVFSEGKLLKKKYWSIIHPQSLYDKNYTLTFQQTINKTKELFFESIENRMVADVPVAAFLSGGIDSSAIVAAMSRYTSKPIETYCITFEDRQFDESTYARIISDMYSTKHSELLLRPNDLLDGIPGYIKAMDSPTTDGINTFIVSKMVAEQGIRVALSGLGGDELFCGYAGFKRWHRTQALGCLLDNPLIKHTGIWLSSFLNDERQKNKFNSLLSEDTLNLQNFYLNSRSIFLREELTKIHSSNNYDSWIDLDSKDIRNYPSYGQYSIAELTGYTLDVLLKDTDQMSMASSLEVREPFFDYKLIEFILSIPDKYKYSEKIPKNLLVQAMGELIPNEIIYRQKKGFSFPWEKWIRNELRDFCEEKIIKLSERGIFEKKEILLFWNYFLENKHGIIWLHIWAFVILESWLKENEI